MKFTLTIELDNEAMRTGYDVAAALRDVADRVDGRHGLEVEAPYRIADVNGNSVGSWEVTA